MRALTLVSFFASILFAPWLLTVSIGVFLIAFWQERVLVLLGAILMDVLFGVSVSLLGGFACIYTTLFAALVATELFLRMQMIE